jgi:dihydroorotate dehydrogenase electron transfer subunit
LAGAFLRRPFSIADRYEDDEGQTRLVVISRAIGSGTQWLDARRAGETLNLTGPLGRGFRVPPEGTSLVLIGGGVGIPPLLYLSRVLHATGRRDVTVIFGAMRASLFPVRRSAPASREGSASACLQLPGDAPYDAMVTTDDGSLGMPGRVTDALRAWRQLDGARRDGQTEACVLACGPEPMLRAVARLTRELGQACQLCIERTMGCGLGTCLSCVAKVRAPERPAGWRWAMSCTEGPVFDRDTLVEYD